MLAIASKSLPLKPATANMASKLFITGTVLFSGSIYVLVLSGYKKLGIITPFGGTALILGWLSLML